MSIVFSWLWAEIVSVIGVSSGINIVIVVMNISLVFWVGIIKFLFDLLAREWGVLGKRFLLKVNCGWYIRFFIGVCECVVCAFN